MKGRSLRAAPFLFALNLEMKKEGTMANIFKKIGIGIADVGEWVANAVKDIVGIAVKVERVLTAGGPLEKPFIDVKNKRTY